MKVYIISGGSSPECGKVFARKETADKVCAALMEEQDKRSNERAAEPYHKSHDLEEFFEYEVVEYEVIEE